MLAWQETFNKKTDFGKSYNDYVKLLRVKRYRGILKGLFDEDLFVNVNSKVRAHHTTKFTRIAFLTITVYEFCSVVPKVVYLYRHFYASDRTCVAAELTPFASIFTNYYSTLIICFK